MNTIETSETSATPAPKINIDLWAMLEQINAEVQPLIDEREKIWEFSN